VSGSLLRGLAASERVRFLVVGGFNTVLGFGIFVVLQTTLGDRIGYLAVLTLATAIAILAAYCGHRWITFQVRGQWLLDLARFSSVFIAVFVLNVAALPLLVEVVGVPPIPAQGAFVVVTVIASYVGHRNFSFRR
jgi:putative flippase GtrA